VVCEILYDKSRIQEDIRLVYLGKLNILLGVDMKVEDNPTSDESLRKAIFACFALNNPVDFADLRVGVMNGVVHLAGAVPSIKMRILAEELAREVPGVCGVVNRIEAPGAPSPGRTVHLDLSTRREQTKQPNRSLNEDY